MNGRNDCYNDYYYFFILFNRCVVCNVVVNMLSVYEYSYKVFMSFCLISNMSWRKSSLKH